MLKPVLLLWATLFVTGQKVVKNGLITNRQTQQPGFAPILENRTQMQQPGFAPILGISRQPSAAAQAALLDSKDTAILLLDHQTGLFQSVNDIPISDLRMNAVALAKIGTLAGAPIIMTASEPNGPNGPLMEELSSAAPNGLFVPRRGEISAWENADFVAAVEATGKKTLVMAGVWTSVCVAFPALQAKLDGYKVYAVIDASGDPSGQVELVTLVRLVQAGIIPITANAVLAEFQRTWNRTDSALWGNLYSEMIPAFKALKESYLRAQNVSRQM